MDILKKTIYVISPILEYLFNLSISKGKFPNILKISKVIPLFKNGDTSNITNYRPISLISQFAKIFEKIIKIRMISFIDKYELIHKYIYIYNTQFGFQKNIDTSVAINMLMNDLIRNLEEKYISSIVSIDLKKAFDTINHDILLNKLSNYGFRGVTLDFVSSYLNDRKQKTVYFNNESDLKILIMEFLRVQFWGQYYLYYL